MRVDDNHVYMHCSCCHRNVSVAHILECIWMGFGSHQTACGAQEFGRFGLVQSVNICHKPSLVASEQYWR